MRQQNYISNKPVPSSILTSTFNFSGFLFYVNGWSWDNLPTQSNYNEEGVEDYIKDQKLNFKNHPRDLINFLTDEYEGLVEISDSDAYKKVRLYLIAATCRKYQVYSPWNSTCRSLETPSFLQTYSIDDPNVTPSGNGHTTWTLSEGEIQSYTNEEAGNLSIGSYVFAKNLSPQTFTPIAIDNSSKNFYLEPYGFGENITSNIVDNYYNNNKVFGSELLSLNDGWYGIITEKSTPYAIYGGIGLNFDTFFKLKDGIVIEFHNRYPQSNYIDSLSDYGRKNKDYIVNNPWDYTMYDK